MRRLFSGLLILACLLAAAGAEAATTVNTFAELRDAVKNPDSLDIALGADITITAAIPVSLDATIQGNGKTLTVNGAFRHFDVQGVAGNGPTFKGVTFDGGAAGGGVTVVSGGKATFEGGTLRDNRAASGGAVSIANGGEATFKGTAFTGNRSGGDGGAVSVAGTATFSDTVSFSGNTAAGSGGAVCLNGAAVEFPSGVRFENNTAANGGAVALSDSSASKATFNGNVLSPNTATGNGGALYVPGSATVDFKADQEFRGNKAANGGAVWSTSFAAPSHTLTFTENTATADGGALHLGGGATIPDRLVFRGNKAARGGAVYAASTLTVAGGTFAANTASESGGALYTAGMVTVRGGTFEAGNSAEGVGTDNGGGAIWAQAIQIEPASDSIRFSGQTAKKDGGALFSNTSLAAKNAIFSTNEAGGSGGAVMAKAGVTLTNTAFSQNKAVQRGGAVYAGEDTEITLSAFDGNVSKGDGGAVALDKNTSSFKMASSSLQGNSAGDFANSGRGGALYLNLAKAEIDKSTFAGNSSQSSSNGQGGAVALTVTGQSTLTNCTFTGNTVKGNTTSQGGALWLSGPFVLTFSTLSLENTAAGSGERLGGGVFVNSGKATLAAVLAVGNKADFGADLFRGSGATLATGGYNRVGRFGILSSGAGDTSWANPSVEGDTGTDRQEAGWTSATFFGSNVLAANSGPSVGPASAPVALQTLALNEASSLAADNRAMDAIPASLAGFPAVDQRGVVRPQPTNGKKDVGAYEAEQSGGGGGDPDGPSLAIRSLRMSGIPNTLTRVGQTAVLTATVVYVNGTTSTTEKVAWSSSNPGVARIDAFGNLVALSLGRTVIRVATARPAAGGKPASDSATLEVREEMSYTNVHPEIWQQLGLFNDLLSAQGAGLGFADSDPARVRASAFQAAFRKAWSLSGTQITRLGAGAPIRFRQEKADSARGWSAAKPAIAVSLSGRKKGDMLPLKYRWSLSWDELSRLLGREVTRIVSAQELFGVLKLVFAPAAGASYAVVDANGDEGVAAARAASSGALELTPSNNGLTLELTAFVTDASSAASGPQLIDGLLVIPDGTADGTISGALGLLQKPASGGGGSKGEGGGGCAAGTAGAVWLLLALPALLRKRR